MLAQKIKSVTNVLQVVAHQVTPEVYDTLRLAREELLDAYDLAKGLEDILFPEEAICRCRCRDGGIYKGRIEVEDQTLSIKEDEDGEA